MKECAAWLAAISVKTVDPKFTKKKLVPDFRHCILNKINTAGKQKKPRTKNVSDFLFVENNGFEPSTSCMPCKRSSQLS